MSSEVAIRARGLSKCYAIFKRPEDRLKQMLSFGRRKYYQEFWAVRNVDLDVHRGETIGIVGRNGSGKSTLLQLICGTLAPTAGELTVNGRIAALLELGAGFSPEFTGRENVFMNATILGLAREEIERRFDSIAAFADIGSFIDQPVKTYSSGMFARLAFAVAISVDPDVLIVDEALSVGDEAFQRKCFARIGEIKEKGGTILFVSHSAGTVIELCDRAMLFENGERLLTDRPKIAISYYQKLLHAPAEKKKEIKERIVEIDRTVRQLDTVNRSSDNAYALVDATAAEEELAEYEEGLVPKSTVEYESRGIRIRDVHIEDGKGRRVNVLLPSKDYWYCYFADFQKVCYHVRFGMLIKTVTGVEIGGFTSHRDDACIEEIAKGESRRVKFHFHSRLNAGTYFGNAGVSVVVEDGRSFAHRILDATMFRVKPVSKLSPVPTGIVDLTPCEANGVVIENVAGDQ